MDEITVDSDTILIIGLKLYCHRYILKGNSSNFDIAFNKIMLFA